MKHWHGFLAAIICCMVFASMGIAQEEDTELPPEGNIVIVDSAFVRGGPSNDFIAVGALFLGDRVTPLNRDVTNEWILIPYSRGTGWVQRTLVRWEDEDALSLLPLLEAGLTPTPRIEVTNTPFIPTATPQGNYINVDGAASAYVRAGPGRGYLRLGQLLPGETVEPVAKNDDTSWIMIRFSSEESSDEFGWVAFELVYWEELDDLDVLPIIDATNLTPTATFTPSRTPSVTPTITPSLTVTVTATDEPTSTPTLTDTASPTITATNTSTATQTSSPTNTITPSATATDEPTSTVLPTATDNPTATQEPTLTATATFTVEPTATPTEEPTVTRTATPTDEPTSTASPTEEPTSTETVISTDEPTSTASPTEEPTSTETVIPTDELTSTASPTEEPTSTETVIPTDEPTSTATSDSTATDIFAIPAPSEDVDGTTIALEITPQPPEPNILEETATPVQNNFDIPPEAVVGVLLLLLVFAYIWFYWQGLSTVGRYTNGFIIESCPVCQRGELHLDERPSRIFGIPTVRRTVRCDECRSVLRETGSRRWRYAVDRIENSNMYDRFNNRQITDTDLERLVKTPSEGVSIKTSPEFVDQESQD